MHVNKCHQYVREEFVEKTIKLEKVNTKEMVVDFLTKLLHYVDM